MRAILIFLGFLLLLGGGAVAGAQYAPVDLSTIAAFDSVPGSREFLASPMALYVGAGVAAFGLLLMIIAALTGGKKAKRERTAVRSPEMGEVASAPRPSTPVTPPSPTRASEPAPAPVRQPTPPPVAPRPVPPQPVSAAAPVRPMTAAPPAQPAPVAAPEPPKAKPQASAQAPSSVANGVMTTLGAPPAQDPRMVNRKRIQDLVTVNDALKAYHAKNGSYPKADGLVGFNERGPAWIPGLTPDFLRELPRDPLQGPTTQYVYVSDGANYKLLAQGASLVGSTNVEVLGVRIDQTRNPTPQNASYGFWTPDFASA